MSLPIDLSNKRAFVSGATRGIGLGVARALAQAGCDVAGCALCAPDSATALNFIKMVESYGQRAVYFQGDLAEQATPAKLIAQTQAAFGTLDILISNAGRNMFKGVADCTEAEWTECMDLNLAAHWRLAQAAHPIMTGTSDAPGVIVIMGSNHAFNTIPHAFPYNVAKAGLVGLVQSLAIEWGPTIRAVGIAPGFIETEASQVWFDTFPDPQAERSRTEQLHPVGRMGSVAEIGALCAFLASPFAGFISGTTLLVDGGRSALMQDG